LLHQRAAIGHGRCIIVAEAVGYKEKQLAQEEWDVEEAAFFTVGDGRILVRAEGHMTALLCPSLKARIFGALEAPEAPACVDFDLSACEYMDSTFLGLIVGVCKRLKSRSGGGRVVLHRTNEACLGLLRTIGVLGLVELSSEPCRGSEGMERIEGGPKASARFILDAHEELSALSEENRSRFSTLAAALRGALKDEGAGSRD